MHQSPIIRTATTLIAAVAAGILGGQIVCAQQQQPIKRMDLLKTPLSDLDGKEIRVLGRGHSARRGDRTGTFIRLQGSSTSSRAPLFWS